jgi:stearoyl-CoA desaturase (Delta-9 desaturase)
MSVIELDSKKSDLAEGGLAEVDALPPRNVWRKFDLRASLKSTPFFLVHFACVLAFFVPFSWWYVALAVGLYYFRMWGITGGFHRYFSHRSYKTSRVFQFVLAWVGTMCLQKGVLWWAAHHRAHHRYSDTDQDIHSPTMRGILWAHVGWIISTAYDEVDWERIKDFSKYPELRWLERHYLVPYLTMCAALLAIWGWPGLVWGGFVSTTILWHGTFTINSLSHVFGKVRYETTDTSKNNFVLALITMGEGWHNNHHYYQASANQGFFWWEVDMTYYTLVVLEKLGIVWDVKRPSKAVLEGNRVAQAA